MLRNLVHAALLLPSSALAWGPVGHSTVCEIAYAELTPDARGEVDRLIDTDRQYDSFAESCNWADGPPRQRGRDHYVNFTRSTSAVTVAGCELADTCLFTAIDEGVSVLASRLSSRGRRLEALKLLGHWVGDIHQPMHTSFGDDRGANAIEVVIEANGLPVQTNLHAIWDGWIISTRLGNDYRELARRLRDGISDAQRSSWQFDSPIEWADESFRIATSPDVRYCVRQHGACWYASDNMMLDRGEPRRRETLDEAYAVTHQATVERRLAQAGVRLGALLNRLFD